MKTNLKKRKRSVFADPPVLQQDNVHQEEPLAKRRKTRTKKQPLKVGDSRPCPESPQWTERLRFDNHTNRLFWLDTDIVGRCRQLIHASDDCYSCRTHRAYYEILGKFEPVVTKRSPVGKQ